VERVFGFFRDADVEAEARRGGKLWINNHEVTQLASIPRSGRTVNWDSVIDELALRYATRKFIKAISDNTHFGGGVRAFLRRQEKGFAITYNGAYLATIRATSAQIPRHGTILGNFLKPGPHWEQVAEAVHNTEVELKAELERRAREKAAAKAATAATGKHHDRALAQLRLHRLPDDLAPELIAACLEASRRIRLERQVAYEE
jgi:hypothetical protein